MTVSETEKSFLESTSSEFTAKHYKGCLSRTQSVLQAQLSTKNSGMKLIGRSLLQVYIFESKLSTHLPEWVKR